MESDIKRGKPLDVSCYSTSMQQYYYFLAPYLHDKLDPVYQYAFFMRGQPVQREIIESLILSDATPERVQDIFEVQPVTFETYKELFFETDNLVSKLDMVSYLEDYPDDMGRALKVRAYTLGPDFLFFRYGNITPSTSSQKDLVKKIFLTSAYKAMEANYNSVGAANSKAATQHATVMLKAYEAIMRLMEDPESQAGEALMKVLIGENDHTVSARKAVPSGEII